VERTSLCIIRYLCSPVTSWADLAASERLATASLLLLSVHAGRRVGWADQLRRIVMPPERPGFEKDFAQDKLANAAIALLVSREPIRWFCSTEVPGNSQRIFTFFFSLGER
jgi:hypothetical protein